MTDRDKPEFLEAITAMAMLYRRECPMAVIDLYFQVLRDLEIEQVKAAVVGLLGKLKFMPLPAEIREAIEGPQPKTSHAERAWTRLLEMVKTLSQCNLVQGDDPALAKALRVVFGSWDTAVRRLVLDAGFDEIGRAISRKDFCAAYETAMAEGVPTSGLQVLRTPQGPLRAGSTFALGICDGNGVRVHEFEGEAQALTWRDRKALQPAPARALVAHGEN